MSTSDKLLGFAVRSGMHEPDPDNVAAIQNFEIPKLKKHIRSIVLSLLFYFLSYVPLLSDISHQLIELTNKRTPNEII